MRKTCNKYDISIGLHRFYMSTLTNHQKFEYCFAKQKWAPPLYEILSVHPESNAFLRPQKQSEKKTVSITK